MTNWTAPAVGAATRESGVGIGILDASGTVQARAVAVETVVMAIRASASFPSVDAPAHVIGNQIDTRPVVLARIAYTFVHIYNSKRQKPVTFNLSFLSYDWQRKKNRQKEKEKKEKIASKLTLFAGESFVAFWTDAMKRVDTINTCGSVTARVILTIVHV